MKKTAFLFVIITNFAFAQVGVNTATPKATFDINAKNPTGTTKIPEGLIIPRVDRERAQSMSGITKSTLIYVDNISTGTQTGIAINIDEIGYYQFDGKNWIKLNTNIYNANGTLSENRIVTQSDKTLAFTGNSVNAFSVDGSTFSVDAANNKVGIGTSTPLSILTVLNSSAGSTTDAFTVGINNCGSACGQGTARNISLFNGNKSNTQFATIDFIPSVTANGITGASIRGIDRDEVNNYAGLQFLTRNATDYGARMTIKASGNIGIGTSAPKTKLDVYSETNGAIKIVDGTQGANKVLTSDANGVATWQTPAASTSTNIYTNDGTLEGNRKVTQNANTLAFEGTATNSFSVDGSTFSIDAANNRVGVGTIAPVSDLQILGSEMRIGGPSTQTGSVDNPVLRIHSKANASGLGGELRFNEDNTSYGYYIKHSSEAGTSGYDGLAIGAAQPGKYSEDIAKPGIFVSDEQNIGIGTATPQNIFHVDSGFDNNINAAPSAAQQVNDVVIARNNGNVGIGNVSPSTKLDISSSKKGAVKIVDGTQKEGYVLTSDKDGVATWQQSAITFGTVDVGASDYLLGENIAVNKYVGVPITLPPGKWLLNLNIGIEFKTYDASSNETCFIRFRLGDNKNDIAGNNTFINDSTSPRLASQGFLRGLTKGIVSGNLAVNNASGSSKTYYLFVDNSSGYQKVETWIRLTWNETSITYQKIQ